MASNAYSQVLLVLLQDAKELDSAHSRLRTGQPGRQWGLGAINRAAVVMSLSAWEAYIENVVIEAINSFRPNPPHPTLWQSLNANALSQIGRFNTPNVDNVRRLVADTLGLPDIDQAWHWQNTTVAQARNRLTEAINFRHQIAHGVNPRPTIHNNYTRRLPGFFRMLARATDDAVRNHLVSNLMVPQPW